MSASVFSVGDRVKIVGDLDLRGATGEIVNTPGKVFNGWNVRLDKTGLHVGIDARHLGAADE